MSTRTGPQASQAADEQFAAEVRAGLSARPKTLPPKYLYDALGSSLFESITQLPEYGLWRAERALLCAQAARIAELAEAHVVIEFGSGSANKTQTLLQAMLHRGPLCYCAIDLSASALAMTARELGAMRGLTARCIEADYLRGLERAMQTRTPGTRCLVLFLGSSIGNFDDLSSLLFLQRVRHALLPGDALLLGADLQQAVPRMLAAYDDALGVTAAFNRNLLVRINRELGGEFDLAQFRHQARYNVAAHAVEMHLESLRSQRVRIAGAGIQVEFQAGETIHTESSHKYRLEELHALVENSGFSGIAHWQDADWPFVSALYGAR